MATTELPPYNGPYRYIVPLKENAKGERTLMFGAMGNIELHPAEQMLMNFAPGMTHATIYTYLDLRQIIHWLQEERKQVTEETQRIIFDTDEDAPDPETLHYEGGKYNPEGLANAQMELAKQVEAIYGRASEKIRGIGKIDDPENPHLFVRMPSEFAKRAKNYMPTSVMGFPVHIEVWDTVVTFEDNED